MLAHRIKNWLGGLVRYRPTRFSGNEWNLQYSTGRWDSLGNIGELAHHSIIAGYFRHYSANRSVLDVCCGEGVLQGVLGKDAYSNYVGVDISSAAIAKAEARLSANTTFFSADVAAFIPAQCFSVIVFNECLYYFEDPLAVLERYERFLCGNGVFVVSMYVQKQPARIWRMIDANYQVQDETKVTNSVGVSWTVKAIKPRGEPAPANCVK